MSKMGILLGGKKGKAAVKIPHKPSHTITKYGYPKYDIDISIEKVAACRDIAQKLLANVGLKVNHEAFVKVIKKHRGVSVVDGRICLDRKLTDRYFDEYIDRKRVELQTAPSLDDSSWSLCCGGYSIAVIDIATDETRPATSQDLRDLIRLCHSFDISGDYPCAPQDVPPLMRSLACFKICWEESDRIRPFDYLDQRQTPFLYEMHQVMGKPFVVTINISEPFTILKQDVEIALHWYPKWKQNHNSVAWYPICDYSMLGITKPITSSGSIVSYLSQSFGTHILFRLYDSEWEIPPRLLAGMPVDLRNMCWAWGSPRQHLYDYMNACVLPSLCGITPEKYRPTGFMASGSCVVDSRAGLEKSALAIIAAMQGARRFYGAGNLAVDDLFSGVQLALDVEIFEYVKEVIESFTPHSDIMSTDGVYDVIREVALGQEEFYSHIDTAKKVRNLLPVSKRRPAEKLRSWMMNKQNLKERLREECLDRIRTQEPFQLPEDKRRELEKIYKNANSKLANVI